MTDKQLYNIECESNRDLTNLIKISTNIQNPDFFIKRRIMDMDYEHGCPYNGLWISGFAKFYSYLNTFIARFLTLEQSLWSKKIYQTSKRRKIYSINAIKLE